MIVSQDQEAMLAEIETALRELQPEGASGPPVPSQQPQVPSEEPAILDGIDWPEQEGEPDPNHPGRIKYVQPNEEDMSVYDTSAILTAWENEDPVGLSEEGRAIYDAAKAVLGEIIRDEMIDYEKEAAVYDWVTRNIGYGWSRMDVLEETPREAYTPYGGLVDQMATCMGFATSLQLLLDMAGVALLQRHQRLYGPDKPPVGLRQHPRGHGGRPWEKFQLTFPITQRPTQKWRESQMSPPFLPFRLCQRYFKPTFCSPSPF